MGQLVEFDLNDGGTILVEVHEATTGFSGPVTRGLGGDQVTERARYTFEDAVQRVEAAAQAIITRLRGMAQTPDEVQVEFGLDLHAEAGAFIAAASATANFRIAMTWRRTDPSPTTPNLAASAPR
jgi:Trypsin-co-occurring domain 1